VGRERLLPSGETERRISSSAGPGSGIGPGEPAGLDVRGPGRNSHSSSSSTPPSPNSCTAACCHKDKVVLKQGIHCHGQAPWSHSIPSGERPREEACAGTPPVDFSEEEMHHGAWSSRVTLPTPTSGSHRACKPDRHTAGVLPTRLGFPISARPPPRQPRPCHPWNIPVRGIRPSTP
jgi:hypothetical protein